MATLLDAHGSRLSVDLSMNLLILSIVHGWIQVCIRTY